MPYHLCGTPDKVLNLKLLRRKQSDKPRKGDIIQRYFKIDNAMEKEAEELSNTERQKRNIKHNWILALKPK